MKPDFKKSLYRNAVSALIFSCLLILLSAGCDREKPTEPADDRTAPAEPRGLNVFREHDGQVGIEWSRNLERDISRYNIYRSADSIHFTRIDSTTNLYYVDTGLVYDSTYYYKITAVDETELESGFSSVVSAKPVNRFRPFAPYGLKINARNWNGEKSIFLNWTLTGETDISHFDIHRSAEQSFTPDSSNRIGSSARYFFEDTEEPEILKEYYYKVVSVDKGGLKSDPSFAVADIILDEPKIVFPASNAELDYFSYFKIRTCSYPATYKIVIQTNEIYGVISEIDFTSEKINEIIDVKINGITIRPYEKYYWRIFAYTINTESPNSFSELGNFTIIPGN